MNFWESEIRGALEWNLICVTWQLWGSARNDELSNKSFTQDTFNSGDPKSHNDTHVIEKK